MNSRHIWVSISAILLFGFLLSRGYGDAGFLMRQGNFYFNGGAYDLEKAERAFQRAVRIEPGILWGHYQLARIYFVKGNSAKAIEEINKELEANPENLRSLYVRGLIYGFSGRFGEAEEDFRRFTLWAPKEWAGYNDLAWILAKEGKYREAKEVLLEALKKTGRAEKNSWLWNSLGVAELNLGEYANARKSFTKAKESASMLPLKDWQDAYPGNNPEESARGLADFKRAIEENLKRSLPARASSVDSET